MNHYLIGALLCAASLSAGAQALDGKALFQKNCAACHQANGKGIPGAFPALAGNPLVQGAPAEVTTVLLKGRGGMPDFSASLSDADIAQVITYARSSWGNRAGAVPDTEVASLRASLQAAQAGTARLSNKH
jgi:mono/diheme cytochrome c family protein